jgi:hypothetical protein
MFIDFCYMDCAVPCWSWQLADLVPGRVQRDRIFVPNDLISYSVFAKILYIAYAVSLKQRVCLLSRIDGYADQ